MAGRLKRAGFRVGVVQAAVATGPQVFDFSSARLDPAALKTAGLIGVARYQWITGGTRPQFNQDKAISRPEYDSYLRAGLSVALIVEVDKDDYKGGYARGFQYGQLSLQNARSLGHPDSASAILTVQDVSFGATDYNLGVEYTRGFRDGRGLAPIVYGGTNLINRCVQAGVASGGWKAAAGSWSSVSSPYLVMVQKTSKSYPQFPPLSYDENDVVASDWGQAPRPGGQDPTPASVAQATWG